MKQLTEERENLTVDFKEENDELKNKIKALERELTNNQYNHKQQQLNNNNKQSNNKSSQVSKICFCLVLLLN